MMMTLPQLNTPMETFKQHESDKLIVRTTSLISGKIRRKQLTVVLAIRSGRRSKIYSSKQPKLSLDLLCTSASSYLYMQGISISDCLQRVLFYPVGTFGLHLLSLNISFFVSPFLLPCLLSIFMIKSLKYIHIGLF